ncbi:unnamed protein product [Prorocentrum cordatum]|uniref:Uncharacterized protein n=1 Tax=Prorocentrum cordatum TaxID=2364126 RepID=A0ABN9RH91_9DINO|nr:unnamed protein product [Polarella glacialis]
MGAMRGGARPAGNVAAAAAAPAPRGPRGRRLQGGPALLLLLLPLGGAGAALRGPDSRPCEVVNRTSEIVANETLQCQCPPGEFWHWRIKSCTPRGGSGYECGFFPAAQQKLVCQDGLRCVRLAGGTRWSRLGTGPATCTACAAGDDCPVGPQRLSAECEKAFLVSGEACVAVRLEAQRTGEPRSACVSLEEVKTFLGLPHGGDAMPRIGPKLAAKLVNVGNNRRGREQPAHCKWFLSPSPPEGVESQTEQDEEKANEDGRSTGCASQSGQGLHACVPARPRELASRGRRGEVSSPARGPRGSGLQWRS